MKQFKQLAALFLAFAMVVGVFSVPTVAYAAEKTSVTAKVNYETEEIEVPKSANQTIYFTTKYNTKNPASTVWDEAYVQTATKASIDFSNVAAKGGTYYVTDDIEKEPLDVKIQAQESTLAVAFSGVANTTAKSKIKVQANWEDVSKVMAGYSNDLKNPWTYGFLCVAVKGADKSYVKVSADEVKNYLEYKVGATGKWKSITTLNLKKYIAAGAQLYFRIKGTNDTVTSGSALTLLGRTSKEVKVTYTKQANAPKLTIKGDTKQVALTKTMEYRVATTSGDSIEYGNWISVKDNHMTTDGKKVNTVYLKDLLKASGSAWSYDESTAGQSIQVRTAATDKAVASKVRTIKLNAVPTPSVSTSSGISFELVKNTTYDKGIKVTNNATAGAIQVAVVSGDSTKINLNDTKTVKWTTIAANSAKGAKSTIIKGTALEAGDRIIYRYATVKDNTKTAANEFMVSSKAVEYDYKKNLTLAVQSLTPGTVSVSTGKDIVTVEATTGNAINVVYTSTPGAVKFTVELLGTNIADKSAVKLDGVKAETADAATDISKEIVAKSSAMTSGKATVTFELTGASVDKKSKIFRVTTDGFTAYYTVNVSKK